jgi:ATP diphosphatase
MNEPIGSSPDEKKSALTVALKLQQSAAAVGFDWPDSAGPRAKITEELAELEQAEGEGGQSLAEELGDLLFAVVNLARHLNVNPEQALAAANSKFQSRFRYIEKRLAAEGLHPQDVDLARLDALWDEAKQLEQTRGNSVLRKLQDE